jgi:hypothetical protein
VAITIIAGVSFLLMQRRNNEKVHQVQPKTGVGAYAGPDHELHEFEAPAGRAQLYGTETAVVSELDSRQLSE